MQNAWYIYFALFVVVFLIYMPLKRRRKYMASRVINNKKRSNREERKNLMQELAQRFIGKDVYIKLLEGNADGIVKEVTNSGIVLEYKENVQVINLEYVMKIREYPYKKGKRATLWGE